MIDINVCWCRVRSARLQRPTWRSAGRAGACRAPRASPRSGSPPAPPPPRATVPPPPGTPHVSTNLILLSFMWSDFQQKLYSGAFSILCCKVAKKNTKFIASQRSLFILRLLKVTINKLNKWEWIRKYILCKLNFVQLKWFRDSI